MFEVIVDLSFKNHWKQCLSFFTKNQWIFGSEYYTSAIITTPKSEPKAMLVKFCDRHIFETFSKFHSSIIAIPQNLDR